MNFQEWSPTISFFINILIVVFLVYHFFRNPDIKAEKDIALMEAECILKHKRIDERDTETKEDMKEMKDDIRLIKENHLVHIEKNISEMRGSIIKILTILEERNKKI
jgi:hypothetical protein